MPKKIPRVITIATDHLITNFDLLGGSFKLSDDITIYQHRNPKMTSRGLDTSFNFDIMVSNSKVVGGYDYGAILPPERFIHLPRYNKYTQALLLHRAASEYNNTGGFIPVPVWNVGMAGDNYPVINGKVVIKPLDGARGIGHYSIDLTKIHLSTAINILTKLSDESKASVTEAIKDLNGAVVPHWGKENSDGEGLRILKADNGILIQSIIPDVVEEYRVITDANGSPQYFQKRNINNQDSELPQASGGGSLISRGNVIENPFEGRQGAAFFWHLCSTVIGPLNSIDLFFTKDGWGIFEYCNQFGVTGIPNQTAYNMHVEFIRAAVNKLLLAEQAE